MNQHRPKGDLCAEMPDHFRDQGYSERQFILALRLLESVGYELNDDQWPERRRFVLFDSLSKVAFTHVVRAETADPEVRAETLEYALIAQCAMELVCRNKSFSDELLHELGSIDCSSEEISLGI